MSDSPVNLDPAPNSLPTSKAVDPDRLGNGPTIAVPGGPAILLLSGAGNREWAARAAEALGVAWSAGGRPVILSDLHIETPLLRGGGDDGVEGIVDILLYGASPSYVAAPGEGGSSVIRAGTYTPSPRELYRHPGWSGLAAHVGRSGAMLAIFAPAEEVDLEAISTWVPEAILLGSAEGSEAGRLLSAYGVRVIECLVPLDESPVVTGPNAAPPEMPPPSDTPPEEQLSGEPAADGQPPAPAPPTTVTAPSTSTPAPPERESAIPLVVIPPPRPAARPRPAAPTRPPRRGSDDQVSGNELTILILLIVLTVLVMAMFILFNRRPPTGTALPLLGAAAEMSTRSDGPGLPGGQASILAYSVSVKAYPTFASARELIEAESRRNPGTEFFISPEAIQGVVYYRVLAGLTADTMRANELRDALMDSGAIEVSDAGGSWSFLHSAPLAFDLGDFASKEEALAYASSLADLEIPAYATAIPHADGSSGWRLYAGAYRDAASAEWMRRALEEVGVPGALVSRTGAPGD